MFLSGKRFNYWIREYFKLKKSIYLSLWVRRNLEPVCEILVLITWAYGQGSDKPVHLCGLAKAFTAPIYKTGRSMKSKNKI